MDPSYNNGLNNGGTAVPGGAGGVMPGGAGVGDGTNLGGGMSMRAGGMRNRRAIISSGATAGADKSGRRAIISSATEAQTVTPDTGDIMLGGSAPSGKKRRWPFVVIGVLALVAVVLGVVMGVTNMGGGNNTSSALSVEQSFNNVANYVLYGEDSSEDIGWYDPTRLYYFSNTLLEGSDEDNVQFVDDIVNRWDYFKDKNSAFLMENDEDGALVEWTEIISNYMLFLRDYYETDIFGTDEIQSFYLENGMLKTMELITEKYKRFSLEESPEVYHEYYELVSDLHAMELRAMESYDAAGCFVDGQLVHECVLSVNTASEDNALNYSSLYRKLELMVRNTMNNLEKSMFSFSNAMTSILNRDELGDENE